MAIILIILFVALGGAMYAQTPQEHQMKIYTDSTGRIYVNLKQPLYFKISSSPKKESQKVLMHSHQSASFTNPVYMHHEGLNVCYTPWAVDTATRKPVYPRQNVYYQFYADGTPPRTRTIINLTPYVKNDTIFFGKDLRIKLYATDNIAGVENTYYSVNGEDYKLYDSAMYFPEEGSYILKYYSVDHVGNAEKPRTYKFVIDASTPTTNLNIVGNHKGNILSPGAKIILKTDDNLSGTAKIYYSIDGGAVRQYRAPIMAQYLPEGSHIIRYYSVDNTGNTENEREIEFFVDKTAPLILDDIIGENYFINGKQYLSSDSKLKIWALDNKAGVEAIYYSLNGSEWKKYTEPIDFPKTKEKLIIKYYAVDSVGNKSKIDQNLSSMGGTGNAGVFQTFIDLDPPSLSYSFIDSYKFRDTVYLSKNSKIKVWARDNESGVKKIQYQVDSSDFTSYNKPFSLKNEGVHKVNLMAYDQINNISMKELTVKVDTSGPEVDFTFSIAPIEFSEDYYILPSNAMIFISATDNMVGVKSISYTLNNGTPVSFGTIVRNLKTDTDYTLKVIATDYLMNTTTKIIRFKLQ